MKSPHNTKTGAHAIIIVELKISQQVLWISNGSRYGLHMFLTIKLVYYRYVNCCCFWYLKHYFSWNFWNDFYSFSASIPFIRLLQEKLPVWRMVLCLPPLLYISLLSFCFNWFHHFESSIIEIDIKWYLVNPILAFNLNSRFYHL